MSARRLLQAGALTLLIVVLGTLGLWQALRGPRPLTAKDFADRPLAPLTVQGTATTDTSHLAPIAQLSFNGSAATDGSLTTAWVVAAADPRGEQATVTLPRAALVQEVEVATGLQATPDTFARYGRVRILLLAFADGQSSSIRLDDRAGWQQLDITDHVTGTVTATIIDLYPGDDHQRPTAALAELRLWGREQPEAER